MKWFLPDSKISQTSVKIHVTNPIMFITNKDKMEKLCPPHDYIAYGSFSSTNLK